MIEILSLSVILSLDALTFGFSYGVNKIKLPFKSAFIITATGLIIITGAMNMGELMYKYIPMAKFIGGIILIIMGIFLAADFRDKGGVKSMLQKPESTDINHNGNIESGEAMAIGTALSIDSAAVVMGTAYLGIALPIGIMLMQILFMILGLKAGKKIKPCIKSKYIALISGLIIVVMGFRQFM